MTARMVHDTGIPTPVAPEPVPPDRFVVLATALAGRKLDVVNGTEVAYTDGETIFVNNRLPVRSAVIVQALLLGNDCLSENTLRRLRGRADRCARFLLLEMNRLCAIDGPWSALRSTIGVPEVAATTIDAAGSLDMAASAIRLPSTPPEWGEIRPALLVRRLKGGLILDGSISVEAGVRVSPDEDDRPNDDPQSGGRFSLAIPLRDNRVTRKLQKLLRLGRSGRGQSVSGQAGDENSPQGSASRVPQPIPGFAGVSWWGATGDTHTAPVAVNFWLPEWDMSSGTYLEDWCTVIERVPAIELQRGAIDLVSRRDLLMRRRLAKIGLRPEVLLRQPVGDDIDLDAAVRAQVARASGSDPGENLYAATKPRRREISILVLLDVSGSTRDPIVTGGTVFDSQQEAAACLIDSITALGGRTACLAFHSQGRKAVNVARIKSFDQDWGRSSRERMASLRPGGYTRLGAAIRYASVVLGRESAASRRLLVLLSDGFPNDNGYRGAYAVADSRRALAEARHESIGCVCISIGAPNNDGGLAKVFGSAAHAYTPDYRGLHAIAPRLFAEGLRTCDPRRRLTQRATVE